MDFVRDGRCDFSNVHLKDISAHDIREFAGGGRAPATVSSYLTHTCHVLGVAEGDFGPEYHVSLDALERGQGSARRLGLAGKPGVRNRRPEMLELDKLMEYFWRRHKDNARCVPMHLIIPFAIFGCRRQSEITGLRWRDIDGEEILVRKTKHPRKPEGLDIIASVTDEAAQIINLHGKKCSNRIFPYHLGTISRSFTDACKILNIKDLHFHDLRHEGVSWLREKGWSTSHVMMVSGHASTQTLDRYTRLKTRGDKFEAWHWLERLEKLYEISD